MTYQISLDLSDPALGGMTLFTIKTENPLPRKTWIELIVLFQCYFQREPFDEFYFRVLYHLIGVAEVELDENLQARDTVEMNEIVQEFNTADAKLYFAIPTAGAWETIDAMEDFYAEQLMETLYGCDAA